MKSKIVYDILNNLTEIYELYILDYDCNTFENGHVRRIDYNDNEIILYGLDKNDTDDGDEVLEFIYCSEIEIEILNDSIKIKHHNECFNFTNSVEILLKLN